MNRFFEFILNHKKATLFGVFLFLFLVGIIMPDTLGAASEEARSCSLLNIPCNVKGLFAIIGFIIIIIQTAVSQALTWIIGLIIDRVSYTSLDPTRNSAVALGWPIVRDLANIFVVLGFIGIALATILRFKEYEAKALLTKLIIAALLINFSLVICGIAIDASHIVMRNFLDVNQTFIGDLDRAANSLLVGVTSEGVTVVGFILSILSIVVVGVLKTVAYGLFAILFLFRMMALWVLVILSPLAFICYVFPITKKFWDMWWSNFSQWVIVGIPGAFFLNLSGQLTQMQLRNPPPVTFTGGVASLGQSINSLFQFLVPGIFLIIGFIFSLQISAMGGSMAISTAKKVGGWTGKHTGRVAETLSNKAAVKAGNVMERVSGGRTRLGLIKEGETIRGKATNTFNKAQEALGLQGPGYSAEQKESALVAAQKEYNSEARVKAGGDRLQKDIIAGRAGNSERSRADFASAIQAQQKAGKTVEVGALDAYVAMTDDYSAYEKDPRFAHKNKPKLDQLIADGMTQENAEQELRDRAWAKLSVADIREMSEEVLDNEEDAMEFIMKTTAKKLDKAGEEISSGKVEKLTAVLGRLQQEIRAAEDAGETATADELLSKWRAIKIMAGQSVSQQETVAAAPTMDMDALSRASAGRNQAGGTAQGGQQGANP